MRLGNFSDSKSVGAGVIEMRLFFGPGYRLYYTKRQNRIVILLIGGDKSSQPQDIENAKQLVRAITSEQQE
jgi:putative addiction module killer protein